MLTVARAVSAYVEMRRRRNFATEEDEDFHYNGGDIPLETVLFGEPTPVPTARKRLKWVFTVNGDAPHTFTEATQVAVASAIKNTQLAPVCVHIGPFGRLASWLQKQVGLRIIRHDPTWVQYIELAAKAAHQHKDASTNYLDTRMMLATFTRFDIATLGFVDKYVLYADVDVLFVAPVTLLDFLPAPAFYATGTELVDDTMPSGIAFGNAGVMLINVEAMRRTHDAFIRWTFRQDHLDKALDFAEYGPLDQGAFNAFYQGRFDVHRSPLFNWKPYWGYSAHAKMIHFHGPKPEAYVKHRHTSANDNPNMALIFKMCDKSTGCYDYVSKWLAINHSIERELITATGRAAAQP